MATNEQPEILSGAWRKISADEAVKMKAEGATGVDWIEGAGFVVYDAQALAESREQAARIHPPHNPEK